MNLATWPPITSQQEGFIQAWVGPAESLANSAQNQLTQLEATIQRPAAYPTNPSAETLCVKRVGAQCICLRTTASEHQGHELVYQDSALSRNSTSKYPKTALRAATIRATLPRQRFDPLRHVQVFQDSEKCQAIGFICRKRRSEGDTGTA